MGLISLPPNNSKVNMHLVLLPPEVLAEIISYVPVLDYLYLKLAGSHYLAEVIRKVSSLLSRGEYLQAIHAEDTRRRGPNISARRPLEIMISRGQSALVLHFLRKYDGSRAYGIPVYDTVNSECVHRHLKRSFRLALHWAAYYGSKTIVESLLGYRHLRAGKHGSTALHYAVIGGQIEIVDLLLRNGAYVNALDNYGRTPLGMLQDDKMFQSDDNVSQLAEFLRSKGAKLNLHEVIETGEEKWVQTFLSKDSSWEQARFRYLSSRLVARTQVLRTYEGFRISKTLPQRWKISFFKKKRLLRAAVLADYKSFLLFAIEDGVDLNATFGHQCDTALHLAAQTDNPSMINLLLQHRADVQVTNARGHNALNEVTLNSAGLDLADYLIKAGCNINAWNSKGQTPLLIACKRGYATVARLLISHGARVDILDLGGASPLHHAAKRCSDPALAQVLVENGTDVHLKDQNGVSVIYESFMGYPKSKLIFEYLLAQGADINSTRADGDTLLHTIIRRGYCFRGIAKKKFSEEDAALIRTLLLEYGANPDIRNKEGLAPLHLFCDLKKWETLLPHGADPDVRDSKGCTTLHRLLDGKGKKDNLYDLCEYLLRHGANPNAQDGKGYTALMYALHSPIASQDRSRSVILKLLLDAGADMTIRSHEGLSAFDIGKIEEEEMIILQEYVPDYNKFGRRRDYE
ncbi:hypothetical protein FQN57_006510 [Myotisia sp. PD_48]|nr:hypothetical protein FQN57_006510 [Myotisia sp. PD_48]